MAEVALSFLLENLQQVIVRETELLINLKENIEWIETEFRLMVANQQSVEAKQQLSGKQEECVNMTRAVIRRAEDLIETYAKKASSSMSAPLYKKPIYWAEQRDIAMELERLKDDIIKVRQEWRSVDLVDLGGSSSGSVLQDLATSSIVMSKLDSAMHVRYSVPLVGGIKWVRDELAPLHHFLQQIDSDNSRSVLLCLGERQKIWIQELRDIFQFIDESFVDNYSEWGIIGQLDLGTLVSKVQHKILQLYRVYYAYGFGEILVQNGSSSILPRIRMTTPIPNVASIENISWASILLSCVVYHLTETDDTYMPVTYLSLLMPEKSIEVLRVDLKLMKALHEDTRSMSEDLDERVKVWLDQVHETCVKLEALIENITDVNHQGIRKFCLQTYPQTKIARKLRQIRYDIRDIATRRMTYGIGTGLGEPYTKIPIGYPIQVESHRNELGISKYDLTRQVESVGKDLQLMQGLLKDVNRMKKLDARLKNWMEEMLYVAREASQVVELDRGIFYKSTNVRRINRIYDHILIMSRWKHAYGVGDVKSSTRAGIFSHDLEEREEYPSGTTLYTLELYTSEIKMIQSLYSNAVKLDELGTLKACVDEMRKIATVASSFDGVKDTIRRPSTVASNSDRMKDTIRRPSKMWRFLNDFDILNKIVYPSAMMKLLSDFVIFNKFILPQRSRRFRSDFDRLKDKIAQLSEIGIAYGIELAPNLPHDIVYQIKTKLLSAHPCTVPVLGMTSKHKEALQDLVECDNAIAHHFDMHAWVYVPEDINAASILEYVAKQVSEFPTGEELMQDIFIHKRCLVVVDEIRTIEVWDVLMRALRRISTGSRIILIGNEHTYSLLDSISSVTSDISVIVRQLPQKRRDVNTSDMVNVRGLPSYLRQCLYYFVLFPAKFKVPVRRLIVMWVLEGLVRSTSKGNENQSAEQVAEGYLKELIDEGLVLVTKEKLNGKPKACQLKHGTHDVLLEIAKEASFFQDSNGITSRLVDHHDSSDSCFIKIHGNPSSSASVSSYKNVVSFLSFDATEGSKPGEDIGAFLRSCILAKCFESLRILDLERVFRPQLPKELSELTLLRYLGLRWTYLEKLPINITKLINLQMLDMKHTYINVLPKSIWKMRNLRHLYLSENYRTRFSDGPSEISLNDLQTLWGAFIDEDTLVKGGLDTSLNIRKLGLSCMSKSGETAEHLKDVARWISNLEFLESLRLKSRDDDGKAAELHLETLESNENLSTVYLLGKLEPSVVEKFPVNLIEITLSGSELKDDPMEYLKSLPKLLILRLLSQSVVSRKMTCSRGGFAKLKLFYIWKLENLEEFEVEEGALPSLEDMEIRACENLTQLPCVENVKKFTLTSMPITFINKCKEQQPELWDKLRAVLEVNAE